MGAVLPDESIISATAGPGDPPPMSGDRVAEWFADATTRSQLRELAEALCGCPTRAALARAPFWARRGPALRALLGTIQHGEAGQGPVTAETRASAPAAAPDASLPASARAGDPRSVRIVAWNILKGVAFEQIVEVLERHPDLADADVVLLCEVDVGMVRSGNRHVAAELAARLRRHWAFLPNYFELTKGPGEEGRLPGANAIGLHGVAILTRRRPRALRACPLPECFDAFAFSEKRYGGRAGLLAELPGPWIVGTVHLEVRNTPACRARQMHALLAALDRFCAERGHGADVPVLLAGDLNSHTFARGTLWRAAGGALRLCVTSRRALQRQLMEPWRARREPLFAELTRHGFDWRALNDRAATAGERLGSVEDWGLLPRAWRGCVAAGLGLGEREIGLRLDWFFGRGLHAAAVVAGTRTITGLCRDRCPSDHAPIVLELTGPIAQFSGHEGDE